MPAIKIQFILAALLVVVLSFHYWKKAVIFILYWLLLVGAVRKWLMPSAAEMLFFSIHTILFGVYLGFLSKNSTTFRHPVNSLLAAFLLWGVLSSFNPHLPDVKVGILGNVIYFYFIPIIFILPHVFNTKDKLMSFLKNYSLFSLPLLLLGIVQFFSPVNSRINQYVIQSMHVATTGDFPRVTSTFSYITGYSTYLSLLVLILIYMLGVRGLGKKYTVLFTALIPLVIINMFMTGSRGPLFITIVSIALYFFFAGSTGAFFVKKIMPKFLMAALVALLIVPNTSIGRKAFAGFMERGSYTDDIKPRIIDTFTPFKFLKEAGLIGYGIGSTYQGAKVFGIDWGDMPRDFEEEPERIVLEIGLVGYVLVFGLRILILYYFWKLFRKLKSNEFKLLALCIFIFQLQFLHINSLVFNWTACLLYWFSTGFLFLLPKLDMKEMTVADA